MKMKSKNMRKKSVAILAGVAIAGAVGASAASLGGIGGESLGADAGDVTSCDTTGVTIDYTSTFDPAAVAPGGEIGEYVVDSLTVKAVNEACDGLDFDLTLTDGANLVLTDAAGTVSIVDLDPLTADDASFDVTLNASVSAESIEGVALVISGSTI